MKKAIAVLVLLTLLVLPMAFADENGNDDAMPGTKPKARPIHRLHVIGTGLSISADDPMEFTHAKIVVGAVRVKRALTAATTAEEVNFVVKRIGVLMLDEKRYHLKNIAVSKEEISGEIFDPKAVTTTAEAETTSVGKFHVKRHEKPGRDIWAGAMELNGKSFNVYFLGVHRKFRPIEVAEKVGEYCRRNSDNERCRVLNTLECKKNPEQCKEKVTNFCSENPNNKRCIDLKKLYCLKNASDERCRRHLIELCKKDPTQRFCKVKEIEDEKVVTIEDTEVETETEEEGEVEEEITRPIERIPLKPMRPVISR